MYETRAVIAITLQTMWLSELVPMLTGVSLVSETGGYESDRPTGQPFFLTKLMLEIYHGSDVIGNQPSQQTVLP